MVKLNTAVVNELPRSDIHQQCSIFITYSSIVVGKWVRRAYFLAANTELNQDVRKR
jgi:hypothetical protein